MRKKALRKDFYMEIRKSFGRFLSIFFIVAIGTAFFSGIRSAEPDMRLSGDVYFDQSKLMDLQVISTMGLTADDLQAIREIKGVEQAQPVYSMDALCDVDGVCPRKRTSAWQMQIFWHPADIRSEIKSHF